MTSNEPRATGSACYAAWLPAVAGQPEEPLPAYVLHGHGCKRPDTHILRDTGEGWMSIDLD